MTAGLHRTARGGFSSYVHRIQLEAPIRTPDDGGGASLAYALVAEVWGEVRNVSGDETFEDGRLSGRITHVVSIRHRDGVSPDQRLRIGPRMLAIRSVLDRDGRRRHLECRCEEIVT